MFDNQTTKPEAIVAQLLNLADGWKELLGPPSAEEAKPKKARRAPAKRSTRAKG